jgi:hypothetical protein
MKRILKSSSKMFTQTLFATIVTHRPHARFLVLPDTVLTFIPVLGADVYCWMRTDPRATTQTVRRHLHRTLSGLDIETVFVPREDFDMLKQKFYSKDAPPQQQAHILTAHGVRFSCLDYIPGWRPSLQTALDFMHCIFLGE